MKTADFDFSLPEGMIALRPSPRRDLSRLLVLRRDGSIEHRRFMHLPEYIGAGDLLILNDTKVFCARLLGRKKSGGKIDILLLRRMDDGARWEVLYRGRYAGIVTVGDGVTAEVGPREDGEGKYLRFLDVDPPEVPGLIAARGSMPLPPYIKRLPDDEDRLRYQTVYATKTGSIAAPTAGLHFTNSLLRRIRDRGAKVRTVTLHVGPGTFKPIVSSSIDEHRMDREYAEIPRVLIDEIAHARASGGRVFAVGTTVTRTLEGYLSGAFSPLCVHRSGSGDNGTIRGYTDIFMYPGYRFKAVDCLVTNFHLPRSTPLLLVSAFRGFENVMKAYGEAIAEGYRFFSYGDAMVLL